jgi:hypothetical protein
MSFLNLIQKDEKQYYMPLMPVVIVLLFQHLLAQSLIQISINYFDST